MLVEVCVSSISSIKNAALAGADRVELCAGLGIGGLTPSMGLIQKAIQLNILPIHCLIRPRQGHFFYSKDEKLVIENNIKMAREIGCHGIVIGAHTKDFELDLPVLSKWKVLAGPMKITFHRAFDVLRNPDESLKKLIDLGFNSVLSSGQNEKATEGIENLIRWNTLSGSKISIMPGSGINVSNCKLFKNAGFKAIHLTAGKMKSQLPIPNNVNKNISFLNQPITESDLNNLREVFKLFKTN